MFTVYTQLFVTVCTVYIYAWQPTCTCYIEIYGGPECYSSWELAVASWELVVGSW